VYLKLYKKLKRMDKLHMLNSFMYLSDINEVSLPYVKFLIVNKPINMIKYFNQRKALASLKEMEYENVIVTLPVHYRRKDFDFILKIIKNKTVTFYIMKNLFSNEKYLNYDAYIIHIFE
jgi:hypothetical protein